MPLKVRWLSRVKKINQNYFFAENQGVQKQPKGILRISLFMSLSPDKLQLDQNRLLFINIASSEDSWYKCLVTVHALMGWKHHSVNMNRNLLASLRTTSRQQKFATLKGSQIKTQTFFMSWIWPTNCHRIIGGKFFPLTSDLRLQILPAAFVFFVAWLALSLQALF